MHLNEIQDIEASDTKHYFPGLIEDALYYGVALGGETGEVLNQIKKYHRDGWSLGRLREAIRDELADILIYLVMLAEFLDVSLEEEYKEKKDYNERRFRAEVND